ncbi:hypothetical protein HK099_007976 [Clydaea vesicula]|uniref:G-protein coupled receptors family 1 profile domain-containing protein n=1 Tax=Clydaea vesicula TaxID=447962 RepID=A0AAD5U4Z9_9FUNG|nr:hypothetical protein HK099_007976 [Clydaea vesicula]
MTPEEIALENSFLHNRDSQYLVLTIIDSVILALTLYNFFLAVKILRTRTSQPASNYLFLAHTICWIALCVASLLGDIGFLVSKPLRKDPFWRDVVWGFMWNTPNIVGITLYEILTVDRFITIARELYFRKRGKLIKIILIAAVLLLNLPCLIIATMQFQCWYLQDMEVEVVYDFCYQDWLMELYNLTWSIQKINLTVTETVLGLALIFVVGKNINNVKLKDKYYVDEKTKKKVSMKFALKKLIAFIVLWILIVLAAGLLGGLILYNGEPGWFLFSTDKVTNISIYNILLEISVFLVTLEFSLFFVFTNQLLVVLNMSQASLSTNLESSLVSSMNKDVTQQSDSEASQFVSTAESEKV